ncbi:MAG: HEAT repeat domain-containing protein [Bryobacterales bacterium]|nr:HEAT repeat domain-containing protein [Bryobacterales bacterium]
MQLRPNYLLLKPLSLLLACAGLMPAQSGGPRVGVVDFYGVRKVKIEAIRKALAVKEGDPLPKSKGDTEEAIEQVPNVVAARLEAACCEDGKAILYVGIEEKGAPHVTYNDPPAGLVKLPQEVHDEYTGFLSSVGLAVRNGKTEENLAQGHSLMSDPGVRKHQERFIELADAHLDKIREVLRKSVDEEQRAIAAYVIGYAKDKKAVLPDLQSALRDPDDTVRNNAMRSLGAIAVLATREPDRGIAVAPVWFVEMLNSIIWQDRQTAAMTLVTITDKRDPNVMGLLKERALPALAEMARWQHLPHALPAYILLGRVGGLSEDQIQTAWKDGKREEVIQRVLKPAK